MPRKTTTFQCSLGHVRSRADIEPVPYWGRKRRPAHHHPYRCVHCGEICSRRPKRAERELLRGVEGVHTQEQATAFWRSPAYTGLTEQEVADLTARLDAAQEQEDREVAASVERAEAEYNRSPHRLSDDECFDLLDYRPPLTPQGWAGRDAMSRAMRLDWGCDPYEFWRCADDVD